VRYEVRLRELFSSVLLQAYCFKRIASSVLLQAYCFKPVFESATADLPKGHPSRDFSR